VKQQQQEIKGDSKGQGTRVCNEEWRYETQLAELSKINRLDRRRKQEIESAHRMQICPLERRLDRVLGERREADREV